MTSFGVTYVGNARNGENGERSPEGWQFKLDAKVAPWRVTILAKIGDFGEIVRGEYPRRPFAALFWRICNSVLYYLTVIE